MSQTCSVGLPSTGPGKPGQLLTLGPPSPHLASPAPSSLLTISLPPIGASTGSPTLLPVTALTLLYRSCFLLSLPAASPPRTYDLDQQRNMHGRARGRAVPH